MKNTILLVDDFNSQRANIKMYLQDLKFSFAEASSGKEALDILHERSDILAVITDLEMPEMDGIQLAEEIKTDSELKKIPVMMITSVEKSQHTAIKKGVDLWLHKPYQKSDLISNVQKLLADLAEEQLFKVLLVDDVDVQTAIWSQSLKLNHLFFKNNQLTKSKVVFYEVSTAQEAMNALRRADFDLIITDYLMPKVDGLRLARKVKSMPEFSSIPILMISSDPDICENEPKEVEYCFQKPFNSSKVKDAMKKVLKIS